MPTGLPPPTGTIHRFGCFIEQLKLAVARGIGRKHDTLGPIAVMLWNYFGRTLRRLAALQARLEAGTLRAPRPRGAASRPSSGRRAADTTGPRIPRGAVLARFQAGHLAAVLERLVDEPEMRSLIAAAPQAGRLLRPLWRMLSRDPLPEALRPSRRPRRPRQPLSSTTKPANPATPAAPPPNIPPWPRRAAPAEPPPLPTFWPGPPFPA